MVQNSKIPIPKPTVDHFSRLPVCGSRLLDCDPDPEEGDVLETFPSFEVVSEVPVSSK